MPAANRAAIVVVAIVAAVWLGSALGWPGATLAGQAAMPHTAWGDPDFQNGTWNFATMTPLERPRGVDAPVFTEAEAAAFEAQTAARQTATTNNGYDWWDAGTRHLDRRHRRQPQHAVDGAPRVQGGVPARRRGARRLLPPPPAGAGANRCSRTRATSGTSCGR